MTIGTNQGRHPNVPNPASALKRYWTLTKSGDLTAILIFQYLDPDDLPNTSESSLELRRYTGTGVVFDAIPMTLDTAANTATTTNEISDFSDWTLFSPLSPTAANVSVQGRVVTSEGRGVFGARIVMTDLSGNQREARTNPFGYYHFVNVTAGEAAVIVVQHKNYIFAPRVVNILDDLLELDFIAQP